jgi:hypothetical protein
MNTELYQQIFSPSSFTNSLVKWTVMQDQPFTAVESEEIHSIFHVLNPAAKIPSADTIHNHIMEAFKLERTKVRDILQVFINFIL